MLVVPAKSGRVGPLPCILWGMNAFAMKGIVVPSIFELLPDATTDLEMEVWRHRHISGVEQTMNVAT